MLDSNPLGNFHVHFCFHVSLRVGQNKIDLSRVPTVENRENENEANCRPLDNGRVSLPIINAVFLFASMYVKSRLVLINFSGENSLFSLEGPD